ncbi:enoyl-CoA-hydratase DpgB [Streptomyces litchfieldiae]|uniref:Enoyl-CoA-hydratase DpgB n=1 Tax=Streptomyces litchfieldiae TaxID=3075543 RepID=A0ABU2MUW9_9ACTN|nr:enoyl-CoA-hydratase DpgB [Streptomyces sp. DSM 44938]MDT0345440.1 enoyl-CoA-hydratase DpgB [Streptomyces sp. DSM 44938]
MQVDSDVGERAGGAEFQLVVGHVRTVGELTAELNAVCDRAEDRRPPGVVLMLGGSPGDWPWPGAARIQEVNRWERAVRRLERLSAVIIAVARGTCGGPALDLLLAGDYRIAEPGLRMLLPVNDGHFWPGMGVHRLVNQVGVARARQLVLWGHELSAPQAIELGLVDEVTEQLDDAIGAAALLLGRLSGPDLAIRRQLLLEAPSVDHDEALGPHLAACDRELLRLRRGLEPAAPAGEEAR